MSDDARISTGLPGHPKTKKLIRRHGEGAAWRLICLFLWVASNRSDGDLAGMSVEDIELAADWQGEEGKFVAALSEVGFLDGEEGSYKIHDWAEHNPWAAGSADRSEASKWAALCKRYGKDEAARRMPNYAARMRPAQNGTAEECAPHADGTNPQCPVSDSVSVTDSITDTKPNTEIEPEPEPVLEAQPAEPSPKKKPETVSCKQILEELPELEEQTVIDYLAVRRAKKAPLTRTAWNSIKEQILITQERFGIPPNKALSVAVQQGWQGFEAEWIGNRLRANGNGTHQRNSGKPDIDWEDTSWADSLADGTY